MVATSGLDVFAHNMETVEALTPYVVTAVRVAACSFPCSSAASADLGRPCPALSATGVPSTASRSASWRWPRRRSRRL